MAAARRHGVSAGVLAPVLGVAAALWFATTAHPSIGDAPGRTGTTVLLIPVVFGLVHTMVLGIGEFTWPRPRGDVRRAQLVPRQAGSSASRWLVRCSWACVVLACVVLACVVLGAGTVLGAADGRSFAIDLHSADGSNLGGVRRASSHRVLRGAVTTSGVTLGGLLFFGGKAVGNAAGGLQDNPLSWAQAVDLPGAWLASAAQATQVSGAVVCLASLVLLGVPAPRVGGRAREQRDRSSGPLLAPL